MIDGTATLRTLTTGAGTSYRWVEAWPTGVLDTPEIRVQDVPLPRRNGVIPGHDLLGSNTIAWEMQIRGTSVTDAETKAAALSAAFAPGDDDERLDIRFSGTPSEYAFFGRPRGCRIIPDRAFVGNFVMHARCTFVATDPVRYGAEMTQVIGLDDPVLPQTLPFILGYHDSEAFDGSGTPAATRSVDRWTVEMEAVGGSLIDPSIALVGTTSSQLIFHDLTMSSGDTLLVDGRERRALLNGATPVVPTIAQWWQLAPGSNTVRFAADVSSSLTSTATLTWRPGWS